MKFINNILYKNSVFEKLLQDAQNGTLPIAASGLSSVHKALIMSAVCEKTGKKALCITPDEAAAAALKDDLQALGINALLFPVRDFCFSEAVSHSKEYEQKRIDTLSKLFDGDFEVCLCSAEAATQYTVPPEVLQQNTFTLKCGQEIDIKTLSNRLLSAGYSVSDLVEGAGQFSVRGGIVDIFPADSSLPARIEFWGDEIDTINYFDTASQRRTEALEVLAVPQAGELIINNQDLVEKLTLYMQKQPRLTPKQIARISADINMLSSDVSFSADRYLTAVYPPCTVFNYIKDNSLIFVSETAAVAEQLETLEKRWQEDFSALCENGYLSSGFSKFSLDKTAFWQETAGALYLENFSRGHYENNPKDVLSFDFKRFSPWQGDISVLLEDTLYFLEQGGKCAVLTGTQKSAQVLYDTLCEKGIKAHLALNGPEKLKSGITVITGGLSAGFELPDEKFMLITQRYLHTGEKKHKYKKNENSIGSLDELHTGDYVVHASHGIGIFVGIQKITTGGITKDYIKIRYAKTDILYVPITQLDLISKYIGAAEDGSVKLNRLGSGEWQKTRARVKRAVKDMAKQLTALYAKRQSVKGYAFADDTPLQTDFENRFPFVETDDQQRCAKEIKADMQRPIPMDRLLCGDVGFGKTEVALRAAFKCISEGKQCALLVPTTVLAWQHYQTATRRFGDIPVTVKMLSRFVSAAEQKSIVADISKGKVDMVIGTHRLISKDVKFKNIGLVIIDEEQRFGVEQKERLKEQYPFVDILTLSATPIPRTLNMALSGLRDMSTIEEAPGDRQPVQSYVMEYNRGIIIDAIRRELRRAGQVYYLHNRTESIVTCAARLQEELPDARVGIAHGKMSETELSNVWRSLLEHEIDVLVCTSIIETGVDVPNANTLIIEDADRFGLSQLHQLRGRVGRSPRRAYAYFCFRGGRQLSEIAEKRLEAIREYTEFGAGFRIAMRDLEIRGAGSILGGEQHGNMEAVGYDMYLRLLNEAVNEENGITAPETTECTVDLNISAHIPERYIESLPARLGIYKRIAAVGNEAEKSDVIDELCDRFGEPPKVVLNLIDIALLRNRSATIGIYEIAEDGKGLILKVKSVTPQQVEKLSAAFGRRMYLSAADEPFYRISSAPGKSHTDLIAEIVAAL